MGTSPNLGLPLTDASEDTKKFLDWRVEINSSDSDSGFMMIDSAINKKVDKVSGKGLSTNDFLNGDVALVRTALTAHLSNTTIHVTQANKNDWNNKVDKVAGKGLSTLDYTQADQDKLDGVVSDLTTHESDNSLHVTTALQNTWNATTTNYNTHATDTTIHTTSTEKAIWNAKETTAGAQAKADAALAAANAYTDSKDASVSFVYTCTGNTSDSTNISSLINNFFNNGTAMSMKLIISGTMGTLDSTNGALSISGINSRGAVCELDFYDCNITPITTTSGRFLVSTSSSNAKLLIKGAKVTCVNYCLFLNNSQNWIFEDCDFTTTGANTTIYLQDSSGYCSFNNTNIKSGLVAIEISSTSVGSNSFTNCSIYGSMTQTSSVGYGQTIRSSCGGNVFTNCTIIGQWGCYYTLGGSNAQRDRFVNCELRNGLDYSISGSNFGCVSGGISSGIANAQFVQCRLLASLNVVDLGINSDGFIFESCYIKSTTGNTSVNLTNLFTGTLIISNCKLIGRINAAPTSTSAKVKLINSEVYTSSGGAVIQGSGASTMGWIITGNSFSSANIYVNGVTMVVATPYANGFVYSPAYSNIYSATINIE